MRMRKSLPVDCKSSYPETGGYQTAPIQPEEPRRRFTSVPDSRPSYEVRYISRASSSGSQNSGISGQQNQYLALWRARGPENPSSANGRRYARDDPGMSMQSSHVRYRSGEAAAAAKSSSYTNLIDSGCSSMEFSDKCPPTTTSACTAKIGAEFPSQVETGPRYQNDNYTSKRTDCSERAGRQDSGTDSGIIDMQAAGEDSLRYPARRISPASRTDVPRVTGMNGTCLPGDLDIRSRDESRNSTEQYSRQHFAFPPKASPAEIPVSQNGQAPAVSQLQVRQPSVSVQEINVPFSDQNSQPHQQSRSLLRTPNWVSQPLPSPRQEPGFQPSSVHSGPAHQSCEIVQTTSPNQQISHIQNNPRQNDHHPLTPREHRLLLRSSGYSPGCVVTRDTAAASPRQQMWQVSPLLTSPPQASPQNHLSPEMSRAWYETPTNTPPQLSPQRTTPIREENLPRPLNKSLDSAPQLHSQKSLVAQRKLFLGGSSLSSPRDDMDGPKLSPTSAEVCNINENPTKPDAIEENGMQLISQIHEKLFNISQVNSNNIDGTPSTTTGDGTPVNTESALNRAFRLLKSATDEVNDLLNPVSEFNLDVDIPGSESNHFPPISDNKTSIVVSSMGEETIMVKCRNQKCGKTQELAEARKSYKTCHNCYTYYCSRECRKSHWERHKKKCLFSKVNSICKHVIKKIHDEECLTADCTRIARAGYLNKGRGCVMLVFSSHTKAEEYLSFGEEASEAIPVYCSITELQERSSSLGEHLFELLDMCRSYNPELKFIIEIFIVVSLDGEVQSRMPRQEGLSVKKCAKLRLSTGQNRASRPAKDDPETLILTAMPGVVFADAVKDRKARDVCFINIQRQLRQRGVSLRHHYPTVYSKLCSYVSDNEHFTPITIFPYNTQTGKRFMCLIMPDADPDAKWMEKPDLLKELGLSADD